MATSLSLITSACRRAAVVSIGTLRSCARRAGAPRLGRARCLVPCDRHASPAYHRAIGYFRTVAIRKSACSRTTSRCIAKRSAATRYAELPDLQAPRRSAGLERGTAAPRRTAYALWRLGDTRRAESRGSPRRSRTAARWRTTRRSAHDARRPSLVFGRPGVLWVRALGIAHAGAWKLRARDRAGRARRSTRPARPVISWRRCWCRGRRWRARSRSSGRGSSARGARARGDAVGRGRGHHRSSRTACGRASATRRSHTRPAEAGSSRPSRGWRSRGCRPDVPEAFVSSWCNGSAGSLLLWTKGFAVSGDARFLDAARRTAAHALADLSGLQERTGCAAATPASRSRSSRSIGSIRAWRAGAVTRASSPAPGVNLEIAGACRLRALERHPLRTSRPRVPRAGSRRRAARVSGRSRS